MINIAIDGPAGAGKSTIAKAVAKSLNIIYLDTGAMYRATAYFALQNNIAVNDADAVSKMFENFNMDIVYEDGTQQIYVNGLNTTPYLREHYMSKAASDISALPVVRYKMVDLQREFAKTHDVVLDGRDIGTFVLPDANCKFFMTATPEERANRRFKELQEKGQEVDYDQLLKDIIQRDYNDSHREVAPLKQADDAVLLDTTNMSIDEVIEAVKKVVAEKVEAENKSEEGGGLKAFGVPSSEMPAKTLKRIKTYYRPQKSFALYRFLRVLLRPLQCILWPTKVINKENAFKFDGGLYLCNHYSTFDSLIPIFTMFKKEAHILAKYELFTDPAAGNLLYQMGAIPVRRGEADTDSVKAVFRVLKDDKKLLMYPEGTRNRQGTQDMGELKTGAARFAIKMKKPLVVMVYYKPVKTFHKNYLYVGEPFTLEEFYGAKSNEEYHAATEVIREHFDEARAGVNAYVESLHKKKSKKAEKEEK
ncbi:MAG: (d)CMP kinase [Clostridia bacterium]|nr:(d)CMP kinase [Clostridia bacterium]